MANGMNFSMLLGTVTVAARVEDRGSTALGVFKLKTVEHGSNGQEYPTEFVVIMNGDLARAKAPLCVEGARVLVIGTHEVGRVFNGADGQPGRTNDFSATDVRDVASDDMNFAFLFGNLGSDAILKNADTERPFATASLATNLYMGKDSAGASQQRTLWNRLNLNGRQAVGLADSLTKGIYIGVVGSYRYSKPYTTQGGEQRTEIQYNVQNVIFGGSAYRGNGNGTGGGQPQMSSPDDLFAGLGGGSTEPAAQPAGAGEPAGDNLFDTF